MGRTKYEIGCANAAHIRDACEIAGSLTEARALLREAGFTFKRERLVKAWEEVAAERERLAFDY